MPRGSKVWHWSASQVDHATWLAWFAVSGLGSLSAALSATLSRLGASAVRQEPADLEASTEHLNDAQRQVNGSHQRQHH
jgi:hypothetical protein